jgi:hypothetical protein
MFGKALLLMLLFVSPSFGLSKEQILRLRDTGVDPQIIAQRVRANGIEFQPTEAVITELRRAGLPEPLLATIALARVQASDSEQLGAAVRAYQQGRFADASDAFGSYVITHPNDSRARYLLVRSQVSADRKALALANYELLKLSNEDEALRYVAELEFILYPEKQEELRKELLRYLSDFKTEAALAVVDRMHLMPHQMDLLKFHINESQGNLSTALMRLSAVRKALPSDSPGLLLELQSDLQKHAREFDEILKRITWYRLSPVTNGTCTPESAHTELQKQRYSLLEYLGLVRDAARLFPLNPRVLDLEFQASLFSASYEDLESFGDKILEAKGTLRIPFYSQDALFDLVIDAQNQLIYTAPDRSDPANGAGDSTMLKAIPFSFSFSAIKSISQKAQNDVDLFGLAKNSFALKFEPSGLAPHYAFMHLIHCVYGEKAQKATTMKLGMFLSHVLQNRQLQTDLVDADKTTRDWLTTATTGLAIASTVAIQAEAIANRNTSVGRPLSALDILATNRSESDRGNDIRKIQAEAIAVWQERLKVRAFSLFEAEQVDDLKSIVKELLLETNQ